MTRARWQAVRVATLKRLWVRTDPSPGQRLFRHTFYARIALCEPDVWALCGTDEERAKATSNPSKLPQGSRPPKNIVEAWDRALAEAFDGLKFTKMRGSKNLVKKPNGVWTEQLQATG